MMRRMVPSDIAYLPCWAVNVMQKKARLLRCSNGSNHNANKYWRGFPYGSRAGEVGYVVVQLFLWSQYSRDRLLSNDLFKIAHGATLAAENHMISGH